MTGRTVLLAVLALGFSASSAGAQNVSITDDLITRFLSGVAAEKPELAKVGDALAAQDQKIAAFRKCYKDMQDAAAAAGKSLGGITGRVAVRAKCGASNDEDMLKERNKLIEVPEKVGAAAAGMKQRDYSMTKELATLYLDGGRSFDQGALTVLGKRAGELSAALGVALAQAQGNGGGGGRTGAMMGGAGMRVFTPDMTWAYVGYLWGLMYMSGATMFEKPYDPGQWTKWEIADAGQPDQKLALERAMIRRDPDKSEWWRIKTVQTNGQQTDTITLESQFKPLDEQGTMMQVVRMRGRMPGDAEGKELMVPQQLSMLGATSMFPFKPTAESLAGATVGTESVAGFSAKHVKFGAGGGNMEWWLADNAPGGVVKVQFSGQGDDQKWTMNMTGSGEGAQSELGL